MTPSACGTIVVAALCVAIAGCGTVDPEPLPPAPRMVPFSGDPFIETGIRPDPDAGDVESPESGGILLEWRRITTAELGSVAIGAYTIYRTDSVDRQGAPFGFRRIATVTITPAGNDTTFTDTSVESNTRYFYGVRAATRGSGVEGPMSEPVSFVLTQRPVAVSPIGEIDSATAAALQFRFGPPILGGEVAIHLHRIHPNNERIVIDTVWRSLQRATFDNPTVAYTGPALTPGAHYRWRIDKITSRQPIGNASGWVTFVVP